MHSARLRHIMARPSLLAASLALNVLNVLLAAAMVVSRPRSAVQAATAHPSPAAQVRKSPAVQVNNPKPASFHWRQLDAPDFPTFVKNLRAIGCPEATIRDIISGELREIYQQEQPQMQAVQNKPAGSGSAGGPAVRLTQSEFEQIQERQLAVFLGRPAATPVVEASGTSSASSPAAGAGSASAATAAAPATTRAALSAASAKITEIAQTPAAFLATSTAASASASGTQQPTAAQSAAINQMQSDFSNAVQTSGLNPGDPAYRLRWNMEQNASNERFSSLYGGDSFIQTQEQAVRAASTAH